MIQMVCGYKRTGKDCLLRMFNNELPFQWLVYGKNKQFQIHKSNRVSFADNLKKEVNYIYKIQPTGDPDEFKEKVVYGDKTYRDLLILHAEYRRNQDINYWVKNATNWNTINFGNTTNLNNTKILDNTNTNIMITDWRYINEFEWLKKYNPITIRVFRSKVPIPPNNVISEHQLDNVLTDFLLVPNQEDYINACKIFPQYNNFTLYEPVLCNMFNDMKI